MKEEKGNTEEMEQIEDKEQSGRIQLNYITSYINGLNIPINRHRFPDLTSKSKIQLYAANKNHTLYTKSQIDYKLKGQKKMYQANTIFFKKLAWLC